MIKKIVLFNFLAIISLGLSAQAMGEITPNESGLAIVLTLILSAIITPPDVTSQILVSLPLIILYEISIRISARVLKNQNK